MIHPKPNIEGEGQTDSDFKVYMWALSFFRPYTPVLLGVIACGLIVSGIELLIPKSIQYFVDQILKQGDKGRFWLLLGALSFLVLVRLLFMAWQNHLRRVLQEKTARDLQIRTFQQLRTLGLPYFEKQAVGASLAILNTEVSSLQRLYKELFPRMLQGIIFSTVSVLLMLSLSYQLTLVMVPAFLLYYVVGPYFERRASLLNRELADQRVVFSQKVYDSASGLREIRANGAEAWDFSLLSNELEAKNKLMVDSLWFAYWRGTIRRLSNYIGGIAIILLGIFLVRDGQLTTGAFVAFLLYYTQTMFQITGVITMITEQKVLMSQARKLYDFNRIVPTVAEKTTPAKLARVEGRIEFRDVRFEYEPGIPVLNGFSLHIRPGERVALVGGSGGGKTTVLKMLCRFYDPDQGDILLDGVPLRELSLAQIRESIGYVFQETYLFGATAQENIRFGRPDASDEEVVAAAKATGAHEFISKLPNGYETLLGERGVKLSGGQKQRISLARMFLKNPSVVLLDEATAALDTITEKEVVESLKRFLQGRTVITVAHRIESIQDYDKIVYLQDGKVAESGSYQELVRMEGWFSRMLGEDGRVKERSV